MGTLMGSLANVFYCVGVIFMFKTKGRNTSHVCKTTIGKYKLNLFFYC